MSATETRHGGRGAGTPSEVPAADNSWPAPAPGFWKSLNEEYDRYHANDAPFNPHASCWKRPVRELLGEDLHHACGLKKLDRMAKGGAHQRRNAARIILNWDIPGYDALLIAEGYRPKGVAQ